MLMVGDAQGWGCSRWGMLRAGCVRRILRAGDTRGQAGMPQSVSVASQGEIQPLLDNSQQHLPVSWSPCPLCAWMPWHTSCPARTLGLSQHGGGCCSRLLLLPPQTMLLERGRVAQQPHGESSFNIFPLMLAGLDAAERWVCGSPDTGLAAQPTGTPIAEELPHGLHLSPAVGFLRPL